MVTQFILPVFIFSVVALIIFTGARYVMYKQYADIPSMKGLQKALFRAYILGARFDLKVISAFNIAPMFIILATHFLPIIAPMTYQALMIYYFIVLLTFISAIMTDYGFYSYFNDRINYLIWGVFDDDLYALMLTIWKDYNVLGYLAAVVIMIVGLFLLLHVIFLTAFWPYLTHPVSFFLAWSILFVLTVGLTRGTFRHQPLSVKHAYVSNNTFVNALTHNALMLLYAMIKHRRRSKQYKPLETPIGQHIGKISAILRPNREGHITTITDLFTKHSPQSSENNPSPHVVVSMMESFGSQFLMEYEDTQGLLGRLKPHFDADHLFYHVMSDANGTAESFAQMCVNLPFVPFSNALTESQYLNQMLPSAVAKLYQDNGYETRVYSPIKLSWRNIGQFLRQQGFDHVKGEQDICQQLKLNSKDNIGSEWGLYDEYLYQAVAHDLKQATRPQFIVMLTSTNHPPYSVPSHYHFEQDDLVAKYKGRFVRPTEAQKRFSTYEYSNNALGDFISHIKADETLRTNTLIAATGDHPFRGYQTGDKDLFLKHAVPFYLYAPAAYTTQYGRIDYTKFGSHKDIMPTLIELSLPGVKYLSLGNTMLANPENGIGFNSNGVAANQHGLIVLGSQHSYYQWEGYYTRAHTNTSHMTSLLNQYYATIEATNMFLAQSAK